MNEGNGSDAEYEAGMQILKASAFYFALVFGAGLILGTVRTLWVVPRIGVRKAELIEMPIMLLMIVLAARWVIARFSLPPIVTSRLGVGLVALGLLLAAELALAVWLRRLTIRQYLAQRDPVAATVYLVMLGVFSVMPLLVAWP